MARDDNLLDDPLDDDFEWLEKRLEKTKAELRELRDAVAKHRALRYGEPAIGPFYSVDQDLYRAAGLLAN